MSFVESEVARERYDEITEAYIEAFKGEPWWEVSKCPDEQQRCPGGLSALEVGKFCVKCGMNPVEPAYTSKKLIEQFEGLRQQRPVQWYLEYAEKGLSLAALAWPANASEIAQNKYADEPSMASWLKERFGCQKIVWLDEVFANKGNRADGNLSDFAGMCRGFGQRLNSQTLAYRTKTPQMLEAARRDFGGLAELCNDMPDSRRRTFVTIDLREDV